MRNDLWSHLTLKKIWYFFLIQKKKREERLSQWALALRACFHSWLKGCMKISLLSSLYLVSQQLRENFISPRQRFNPPPTFLCMVMELRSLLYHYTPSFLSNFPRHCFQICTETVRASGPLLQFLFYVAWKVHVKTSWLFPPSLLKLMTNICMCLKLCLEVISMMLIA